MKTFAVGGFAGLFIYLALLVLVPEVDPLRRCLASLLIHAGASLAAAGIHLGAHLK